MTAEINKPTGKETRMSLIRQGDVLIVPITNKPSNTRKVKRDQGRVILAYGEVTGHAHAIADDKCDLVTDTEANELYLLVYGDEVALLHEEHDTLTIPKGTYKVVRQREYQPEAPVWVAD